MTRILASVSLATLCLAYVSRAEAQQLSAADQKFLQAANEIGMAEVRLGKMAQEHASSDAVKRFGERMVRDHTRMGEELQALAQKKGVTLTRELDQKHRELASQLSKMRGADFDQAYTKDMVSGHGKAIEKFETEAKNGQDPEVKAWAERWLPGLREHRELARMTAREVK
jgi:putative membrane protein